VVSYNHPHQRGVVRADLKREPCPHLSTCHQRAVRGRSYFGLSWLRLKLLDTRKTRLQNTQGIEWCRARCVRLAQSGRTASAQYDILLRLGPTPQLWETTICSFCTLVVEARDARQLVLGSFPEDCPTRPIAIVNFLDATQ
jgi:hypothetical protein